MASAILPLAGAALSAYGSIEKGKQTSESLQSQAWMAQNQGQEALQQGQYEAYRSGVQSEQRMGESQAAYGAAGVSSNSGSVLDVMRAGIQNATLDQMNILHGAEIRATQYNNQAALDQFGAQSAMKGGYLGAIGSIFGGGANVVANNTSGPNPPPNTEGENAAMSSGADSFVGDLYG